MKSLTFDVDQITRLQVAMSRAKFTAQDVTTLCSDDMLSRILPVVRREAVVLYPNPIIDCDANPTTPYGVWRKSHHKRMGKTKWNPSSFSLYVSPKQQKKEGSPYVRGHDLYRVLKSKRCANSNLLDWLLRYPSMIPEDWRFNKDGYAQCICFWNTLYTHVNGQIFVRFLRFRKEVMRWDEGSKDLNSCFFSALHVALLHSA